jgi:hypothetical protein
MAEPGLIPGLPRARRAQNTRTWNGTTWTKHSPAAHLSARFDAVMANDAATGTVILFGGSGSKGPLADTWTRG